VPDVDNAIGEDNEHRSLEYVPLRVRFNKELSPAPCSKDIVVVVVGGGGGGGGGQEESPTVQEGR
jgi:hypothetical protein